jgi:hypothetical protein
MGLEVFPFERWKAGGVAANELGSPISGLEAIRRTEKWWQAQRKRGPSAATTWAKDYAEPLAPLLNLRVFTLESLKALVNSREPGSRSRRRVALYRKPRPPQHITASAKDCLSFEISAAGEQGIREPLENPDDDDRGGISPIEIQARGAG